MRRECRRLEVVMALRARKLGSSVMGDPPFWICCGGIERADSSSGVVASWMGFSQTKTSGSPGETAVVPVGAFKT